MRHIDPDTVHYSESHRLLLAGVAPRPIALVGTTDPEGRPNLSPFSFFNAFGANPPVIAFSPSYRGTDGTPKHSFLNIKATGEFTVSVVSHAMVEQISLASCDFPDGVDEYIKAGFTKLPSVKIAPFGVAESPMVMECRLLHHVDLGGGPASGNLMIGEVVMFHVKDSVFDGKYPDAQRMDLVARMGGPLYCRASGPAVFRLDKPQHNGIGFDALPPHVRTSRVLTGNHLAKLAGVQALPDAMQIAELWAERLAGADESDADDIGIELAAGDPERASHALLRAVRQNPQANWQDDFHRLAAGFLHAGNVERAWQCALAPFARAL